MKIAIVVGDGIREMNVLIQEFDKDVVSYKHYVIFLLTIPFVDENNKLSTNYILRIPI